MLTKINRGGVLLLSSLLAVGFTACDDDDDYTVADAAIRNAVQVQYYDQKADVANANFSLEWCGSSTIRIIFNEGPFYNPVQAIGNIVATNGLEIKSTKAIFSEKAVDVEVYVPDLNKDYSVTFPLTEVHNGQGEYCTGSIEIKLNALPTPSIAQKPVMATSDPANKLYSFLLANYGSKVLSGQMADVNWNDNISRQIGATYGKTPLINGFDYIHLESSERSAGWIDYTDITPVKNWVADGGIATIGWHWLVPAYPLYGQPEVALPAHLFDKANVGDFVQVRMDKTSAKAIAEWKDADDNSIGKVDSIKGDLMFEIADAAMLAKVQAGGLKLIVTNGEKEEKNWAVLKDIKLAGNTLEWTEAELKDWYSKQLPESTHNSYAYGPNADFKVDNIFSTETTWEKVCYEIGMEQIIKNLTLLKEANIPVLWRPYHEASGQWFWWGPSGDNGAALHKQLWIDMFNRFREAGLDNLIWVWTSQVFDIETWYPGDEYVDIVGCDIYNKDVENCYLSFMNLKGKSSKIVTLSECGFNEQQKIEELSTISSQFTRGCKWSWFMPWYDEEKSIKDGKYHASPDFWRDAVANPNILWLGDYTE